MTRRHARLDGPVSRLQAHAEANSGDAAALAAVRAEALRRKTPEADDLATHVEGMLIALGVGDHEQAPVMDTAARLEATTRVLRDMRARLAAAESGAIEAETRATVMERSAEAAAIKAREDGTALRALHARIHLAPSAPRWLVDAVERAFRHRYSAERYTDPVRRERAVAILGDTETVFAHLRAAIEEPASG